MRRALSLLRPQPVYRAERFAAGLDAAGFHLCQTLPDPLERDLIVSWNRYGHYDAECRRFEKAGATVLVTENSYIAGCIPGKWHALALGHHGGAGMWVDGGPSRWDALGVDLAPWRTGGNEIVILAQRSIGEAGLASPPRWEEQTRQQIGGRIRAHPHRRQDVIPLAEDLKDARCVVTWGSSAALVALMLGIPVFYAMPQWIGGLSSKPLSEWGSEPLRDDAARLAMFRRLIWAQSTVEEIESGEAFGRLLG